MSDASRYFCFAWSRAGRRPTNPTPPAALHPRMRRLVSSRARDGAFPRAPGCERRRPANCRLDALWLPSTVTGPLTHKYGVARSRDVARGDGTAHRPLATSSHFGNAGGHPRSDRHPYACVVSESPSPTTLGMYLIGHAHGAELVAWWLLIVFATSVTLWTLASPLRRRNAARRRTRAALALWAKSNTMARTRNRTD